MEAQTNFKIAFAVTFVIAYFVLGFTTIFVGLIDGDSECIAQDYSSFLSYGAWLIISGFCMMFSISILSCCFRSYAATYTTQRFLCPESIPLFLPTLNIPLLLIQSYMFFFGVFFSCDQLSAVYIAGFTILSCQYVLWISFLIFFVKCM